MFPEFPPTLEVVPVPNWRLPPAPQQRYRPDSNKAHPKDAVDIMLMSTILRSFKLGEKVMYKLLVRTRAEVLSRPKVPLPGA